MTLSARVIRRFPRLARQDVERIGDFFLLLREENQRQNLTRLTSEEDFIEGHLVDAWMLVESGLVSYPAMDFGSGGGVPGLLASCFSGEQWVLVESEGRKAEFLERTARALGLSHVRVIEGRGEKILMGTAVSSVVARAVGPVERIFGWIGKCSTWNNLVLLKGPGWAAEWEAFSKSRYRGKLHIGGEIQYEVGSEAKRRRIVRLNRVPRGTTTGNE